MWRRAQYKNSSIQDSITIFAGEPGRATAQACPKVGHADAAVAAKGPVAGRPTVVLHAAPPSAHASEIINIICNKSHSSFFRAAS